MFEKPPYEVTDKMVNLNNVTKRNLRTFMVVVLTLILIVTSVPAVASIAPASDTAFGKYLDRQVFVSGKTNYHNIFGDGDYGKQLAVNEMTGSPKNKKAIFPEFVFKASGKKFEIQAHYYKQNYGWEFFKQWGTGTVSVTKNRIKFAYKFKRNSYKAQISIKGGKNYYYRYKDDDGGYNGTLYLYKTKKAYNAKKTWKKFHIGTWG